MGTNYSIARIPKWMAEKYRHETLEQMKHTHLSSIDKQFDFMDMFIEHQVYYLGKEISLALERDIIKEPFFKETALQEALQDWQFKVLHEDVFLRIASYFEKEVAEEMAAILTPYDEEEEFRPATINPITEEAEILKDEQMTNRIIKYFLKDFHRLQSGIKSPSLSVLQKRKDNERIVNSALYKYEMFECIRLYKTLQQEDCHDSVFVLITF